MKIFEKAKKVVKKATTMVGAGATSLMMTAVPALAEKGDKISTGISQLDTGLNKIVELCTGLVIGVGVVALIWGIYGVAMSFMQHDESQRISAIPKLVAGVLMIAVGSIVHLMGWG